jgi:hypothetical protein
MDLNYLGLLLRAQSDFADAWLAILENALGPPKPVTSWVSGRGKQAQDASSLLLSATLSQETVMIL